jgi:hypothetical protein
VLQQIRLDRIQRRGFGSWLFWVRSEHGGKVSGVGGKASGFESGDNASLR